MFFEPKRFNLDRPGGIPGPAITKNVQPSEKFRAMTRWCLPIVLLLLLNGCKPSLEQELDARLGPAIGPADPGFAVLVLKDTTVLFERCSGLADLETQAPIRPGTNFRLASLTKQFTASAILLLVSQGSLRLDQTLAEFFPEFPAYGSTVTLRHLLTHTSGVPDYEELIPETATVPVRDRDVLSLLLSQKRPLFAAGSRFQYSNSGYCLLALVVEKVSGLRFADFLKERVFRKAGMGTTLAFENGRSVVADRAFGHSLDATTGGFERTDQSLTSSTLGDGGVYSSLRDLRLWAGELARPQVLGYGLLREGMNAQVRTNRERESYGYGWYVTERSGKRCIRHSGTTVGFRTEMQRYIDVGLTVIVLANRTDLDASDLAFRLADRVLAKAQ